MEGVQYCSLPAHADEARAVLGRFSKNYLPILFNLYAGRGEEEEREGEGLAVLQCVQAYVSITEQSLVTSLADTALHKISDQDLLKDKRCVLLSALCSLLSTSLPRPLGTDYWILRQ